jgi:hypothetical protein
MLLVTPVRAVLAVLLLGVNMSSAISINPTLLHQRQESAALSMVSLLSTLQTVVNNASANSTGTALTNTYLTAIKTNAQALSSFSLLASAASQTSRAAIVCEISLLLFGANVVMPNNSTYTSSEQENW